jgi:HD-GYP domain-containing protein (c-di-GMP phosphodiesterase class II)
LILRLKPANGRDRRRRLKPLAPTKPDDFIPIGTTCLTADQILAFDLYQSSGGQMRLYRNRNYPYSQQDLEDLLESDCDKLYVPESQKDQLYDYTRRRLPALLKDESIPVEDKLDILSETSVNILGRVLDNPMAPKEIRGVVGQCRNHVQAAFQGEKMCQGMAMERARAPFPIAHAISVANLALVLGLRCEITDPEQLHELGVGALLHEIGKTLIDRDYYYQPESKRLKTDPRLRQYPLVGRDMLDRTEAVPQGALKPVAEHQERLDGSGFPFSLKESQISVMGRIVAICDHYDEAINGRANNTKATPFEILNTMKENRGKFDARILIEFIRMLGECSQN